jgi:hypothetical protein
VIPPLMMIRRFRRVQSQPRIRENATAHTFQHFQQLTRRGGRRGTL